MEEKKTKKKPKLIYILIFTLALVLLFTGLFDMKANAAEYEHSVHIYYDVVTYENEEEYDKSIFSELNLTCESPMFVYLYDVLVPITGEFEVASYVVSQSSIQGSPNPCSTFVDNNNVTWYCVSPSIGGKVHSPYSRTFQCIQTGAEEVHYLNCFYTYDEFVQAFKDDTLDLVIDYDSFEVNEDIGVINNLKVNKLNDSKSFNNQVIYDYLTWNNTENLDLQIEFQPVVKIYSDSKFEIYLREYVGEWSDNQILAINTSSYLCAMDVVGSTVNEDEIVNRETWEYFRNIYGNGNYYDWSGFDAEFPQFCYRYRIRYVDKENSKFGRWVYVNPTMQNGEYESYVEELDNSHSNIVDSLTGTNIDIENIGLDAGIESVENENNFKDKYETIDNEADIQEVSNWLKTVVNFISGTPSVVGSVLSFLPQPILYGLYITIFLGIIASGFAIIKALF